MLCGVTLGTWEEDLRVLHGLGGSPPLQPSARQIWCILAVPLPVSVPFPVPVLALVSAIACAVTSRFLDLKISQWSEDSLQESFFI